MDNLPLDLLDLNNILDNDNNGDDDSSSGSSIILDLLRCQNEPISIALEIPEEEGGLDDPLAQFKSVSDETTFTSEIPTATDTEEAIVVAPGECKQPVSLLGMNFVKNLHIHIFFHLESLAIRLGGKHHLAQVDILIKGL